MNYFKSLYLFIPIILFLCMTSYFVGVIKTSHKYELENLEAQQKANEKTNIIESKVIDQQIKYVTKYKYITKEVVKYVNTPNANIILDSNWVWLYNSSISNAITSTSSYDTTAGVAVDTATKNNIQCNEWREEIKLWQQWAKENQVIRKEHKFLGIF